MCVKIVFIFKKSNIYKGLRVINGVKEFRPKRAIRAKKAKRGKLVQTSGWELAHTRNECSQVSIARSAVKAERETGARSANSCAFSKNGAGLREDLSRN